MTARPKTLKLVNPLSAVDPDAVAVDAALGGIGLDWSDPPATLDEVARDVWEHLASTFRDDPTRFRQADRQAVATYCSAVAMEARAGEALRSEGVLVPARGDHGQRSVRNPAWGMWRDASTQVRQWSSALGLTPDSRRRMGVPDPASPDEDNPFMP